MSLAKVIEYWVNIIQQELGSFTDPKRVEELMLLFDKGDQLRYFEIEDTGVFAYLITDDFKGGKCLSEIIFYIRPEHRGAVKLVKKYINKAEQIALENGCNCVKIGANIGFKDSSLIKLLRRWGYEYDTVSKPLGG